MPKTPIRGVFEHFLGCFEMTQSITQSVRENEKLGRELVLDELFDVMLYKRLYALAEGDSKKFLFALIPIEERHLMFWKDFFGMYFKNLDLIRMIKLEAVVFFCRMFKTPAIHLVLEAIEIYGIRKYLKVWEVHQGRRLGKAVEGILRDELEHEDIIVSKLVNRSISPERVRSIFLGFNDGLVELLGVVSGFFAAFDNQSSILVAGFTVAVAGWSSMASGAYVAVNSEEEVRRTEEGKRQFLAGLRVPKIEKNRSLTDAFFVGISYLIGAAIPLLPVIFGKENIITSLTSSLVMTIALSSFLAFLSGMEVKKRIATNITIISLAVLVSYWIGILATQIFGIAF